MRGSTLITALCVIWAVPCPARTITVDADGPADFQMIQAAIDDANDGDVIIIAPGRYTGVGNRDIDLKNKPVTIRSTDPNDPNIVADTIIDCNGTEAAPHCGFYFLGELGPTWRYTEYALSGVTIINGYSPNGGAIICLESHVAVSQCVITDNSAGQHGGGIFCGGWADIEINSSIIARNSAGIHGGGIVIGHPWSDLQIKDCIISQNSANEEGGGIANYGLSATLTNCTLSENSAQSGAGMFDYGWATRLTKCTIEGNRAHQHGGGIYALSSSQELTNCMFSDNSAYFGGGMCNDEGHLTLIECTFNKNDVDGHGGGIYTNQGDSTLIDCTFNENNALFGGGIDNRDTDFIMIGCMLYENDADTGGAVRNSNTTFTLTNCTFSQNQGGRFGGAIYNEDTNSVLTSCIFYDNQTRGKLQDGSAIYHDKGNSTLTNCVFQGHQIHAVQVAGGVIFHDNGNLTLANCTLCGNRIYGHHQLEGGALYHENGDLALTNCTIAENSVGGGNASACYFGGDSKINNYILWNSGIEIEDNDKSEILITYSDVRGGWPGEGNIDIDPYFAEESFWIDKNDPNLVVEPNDPNAVWIGGDYHLKSQAGRWDPNSQTWIQDDVTSPCIDACDPASPIGLEPFPNGGIVNMGTYGGTAEASKSYLGEPVCETIVAGDINGDCKVDFSDFTIMALHWLEKR